LYVSRTVFEILRVKLENGLFYRPLPCLKRLLGRNPLEFLDETYPAKTRRMGLLYGEIA